MSVQNGTDNALIGIAPLASSMIKLDKYRVDIVFLKGHITLQIDNRLDVEAIIEIIDGLYRELSTQFVILIIRF